MRSVLGRRSLCARASARVSAGVTVLVTLAAFLFFAPRAAASDVFDGIIIDAAKRHRLDPSLIKAVISNESRFKLNAQGGHGEIGLMQIKMCVVQDWAQAMGQAVPARGDVFNAALNIEIGTWCLSRAMQYWRDYKYAAVLALCEYNAGRLKTKEWMPPVSSGKISIKNDGTKAYVAATLDRYYYYANLNSVAGKHVTAAAEASHQ